MNVTFARQFLCSELLMTDIDDAQFASRREVSLSATTIKSVQSTASFASSVKNKNGIVVGKWIGDGFVWRLAENITGSPSLRGCILVEAPIQADGETPFAYFDLVEARESFTVFTPRGLNVPISRQGVVCFD